MTLDELRGRATITVPQAAEILSIGRDAAYAAVKRGEIPHLRLGRRVVVPTARLADLLGLAPETREAGLPGPATADATPTAKQEVRRGHDTC